MSIYPVHLKDWFYKDPDHWSTVRLVCNVSSCLQCGKEKINPRLAWGHHAIPWGYGDIWCTKRCYRNWQTYHELKRDMEKVMEEIPYEAD